TSNMIEVQDTTEESISEYDSSEEIEELQEQPQERPQGRPQGTKVSEIEGELEEEPQEETTEINDAATIVDDLSATATNPMTQKLKDNIEEYIYMIDQPTTTENLLTDEEAIEALEKVIRYQESLDVGHGFNENELRALRKKIQRMAI
ncbi:4490_t:CDS:2, partial [Racocetra persica]